MGEKKNKDVLRFVGRGSAKFRYSARELASIFVCPYFYIRSKVSGPTRAMRLGRSIHNKYYREHREGALQLSLREALKMSEEEELDGREVPVGDGRVGGIVDRLIIRDRKVLLIEYKSTERASRFPASYFQALFYGVVVSNEAREVVTEVRDFSERVYYRKRIDEGDKKVLEEAVGLAEKLLEVGAYPPRAGNHCRFCPIRNACPVFKHALPYFMGVLEVAGDGRVHL